MMRPWFEDKVVLVTGGASGIGSAAAQRFAQEGAAVVVADQNGEGAERVAALIRERGSRAIAVEADIAIEQANEEMVGKVIEAFGGLDVAFLNAGLCQFVPAFGPESLEVFDRLIAINLRGTYLGMRAVHARIRPGGAVVVTASAAAMRALPESPAYAASKHGLIGLVSSAAPEFAAKQCRINVICPGGVKTPMAGVAITHDIIDPAELAPLSYRGFLEPQQIAEVALFLASSRAAGCTGTAFAADAGMTQAMALMIT